MEKTLPLEERSIYQIYIESLEAKKYVIPIYQRNYAWEEDEITALVKDVYDSFQKSPKSPYYIGTLVTYKRGDDEYEVIDGQQRLTTIYIILNVLGIRNFSSKLTYGARKVSASTIDNLKNYPKLGDEVDEGIRNGYKFAEKAIEIVGEAERQPFEQYFLHSVHIIHYSVPKDVDLNHYFEVMNSRGEQLEKHEIAKSTLSQYLKDKKELAKFSRVWEACSEMNIYIQQAFHDKNVFGDNLHKFLLKGFNEIPKQDESEGKDTILNLLQEPIKKIEGSADIEQGDKFQPIIDFPNFLLVVLKVTRMKLGNLNPLDFTLDDKELLNEFHAAIKSADDKAEFARLFAFNLLKAKFLLDNYIVHHTLNDKEFSGDNPWKLQYYFETSGKRYSKNLADTQDVQKELVHLLSMFEVSFTPKQRKNYLFYWMMFLFDNYEPSDKEYLKFLQCLAGKYFYDVYLNPECLNERNQPRPNAFDTVLLKNDGSLGIGEIGNAGADYHKAFGEIYRQGCDDIPLFVFNYTDYMLWKKYANELRNSKAKKGAEERQEFFGTLGCGDFELDTFNNFYFSRARKSLEHFYPQAKAGAGKPLSQDDINCFGNFAMIGAEANSSGSNWDPKTKLDHYSDGKSDQVSVASLKFKIMMQMCQDNCKKMLNNDLDREKGMEWNAEDMQIHQKKMLDIIIRE